MALSAVQERFLHLLVEREALRFGAFTLKSGRTSPYFVNTGCFFGAADMEALGECYAQEILRHFGDDIDVIFGPAYKGIPLALATASAFRNATGRDIAWCFDRKEAKDHGDGGSFVGAPLAGKRIVIVDDVLTAGTALRASLETLKPTGAEILGALVSVDRMEQGRGALRARAEITADTGTRVEAIIEIRDAADHLLAHDVAGKRYLDDGLYQTIIDHLG